MFYFEKKKEFSYQLHVVSISGLGGAPGGGITSENEKKKKKILQTFLSVK